MAAGAVAAMAAANAAEEEAEAAEKRRKSHMGFDQILIKTHARFETIGPAIANLFNDRYYDNDTETIYDKNTSRYGVGRAIAAACLILLAAIMIDSIFLHNIVSNVNGVHFDFMLYYAIMSMVVGAGLGFTARFDKDTEWDYVEFRKSRKGDGLVLIRRYDEGGNRNLNEATIHDILDVIKDNDQNAVITGL